MNEAQVDDKELDVLVTALVCVYMTTALVQLKAKWDLIVKKVRV